MKGKLFAVLFSCCIATLVMYDSCIKDKCRQLVCDNGGVCVNGTCACPAGYEGATCSKMWNEKFSGKWMAADSVAKDNIVRYKYEISVAGINTKDSFYITGFANTVSKAILCKRLSYRMFSFEEQKIDTFLSIKSGTGTLDSVTGIMKGNYAFTRKIPLTDTTTKDTTVTVYFSWKR